MAVPAVFDLTTPQFCSLAGGLSRREGFEIAVILYDGWMALMTIETPPHGQFTVPTGDGHVILDLPMAFLANHACGDMAFVTEVNKV